MHGICRFLRRSPQVSITNDFNTALRLPVEQVAPFHVTAQHFLETHRLRTDLDHVFVPAFCPATLVLDGSGKPEAFLPLKARAGVAFAELNDVAYSKDPQNRRGDP